MKAFPLEIVWHDATAPVFSVDFHPDGTLIATSGGDKDIRLWSVHAATVQEEDSETPTSKPASSSTKLKGSLGSSTVKPPPITNAVTSTSGSSGKDTDGAGGASAIDAAEEAAKKAKKLKRKTESNVTFLASLSRHEKPVNVVRFSPDGRLMASGADDNKVLLWRRSGASTTTTTTTTTPSTSSAGGTSLSGGGVGTPVLAPKTTAFDPWSNSTGWSAVHSLHGHLMDVNDVAWSPDGSLLASGSSDHAVLIWDVATAKIRWKLADASAYVQGLAWDPLGELLAVSSADRNTRVYAFPRVPSKTLKALDKALSSSQDATVPGATRNSTPAQVAQAIGASGLKVKLAQPRLLTSINSYTLQSVSKTPAASPVKATSPSPKDDGEEVKQGSEATAEVKAPSSSSSSSSSKSKEGKGKEPKEVVHRHFAPPSPASFFRRLTWSTDGSMLIATAGQVPSIGQEQDEGGPSEQSAILIWSRYNLKSDKPAITITSPGMKRVVSARACPVVFQGPGQGYAQIVAVATLDQVLLIQLVEDSAKVVGSFKNFHYASITDLTWSLDGKSLFASSSDGYCSVALFEDGELGPAWQSGVEGAIHPPAPNPVLLALFNPQYATAMITQSRPPSVATTPVSTTATSALTPTAAGGSSTMEPIPMVNTTTTTTTAQPTTTVASTNSSTSTSTTSKTTTATTSQVPKPNPTRMVITLDDDDDDVPGASPQNKSKGASQTEPLVLSSDSDKSPVQSVVSPSKAANKDVVGEKRPSTSGQSTNSSSEAPEPKKRRVALTFVSPL